MKDRTLLIICLLISISGLSIIALGTYLSEEKVVNINTIDDEDRGKIVKVRGSITDKFETKDGHIFLDVKDNSDKIKVILFKNNYESMGIDENKLNMETKIATIGKVEEYEGELEIIARRLRIL